MHSIHQSGGPLRCAARAPSLTLNPQCYCPCSALPVGDALWSASPTSPRCRTDAQKHILRGGKAHGRVACEQPGPLAISVRIGGRWRRRWRPTRAAATRTEARQLPLTCHARSPRSRPTYCRRSWAHRARLPRRIRPGSARAESSLTKLSPHSPAWLAALAERSERLDRHMHTEQRLRERPRALFPRQGRPSCVLKRC